MGESSFVKFFFNANTNREYSITYKSFRFMNLKLQAGVLRKVAIKNGNQEFIKMFVFVSFDVSYSYHCDAEFGFSPIMAYKCCFLTTDTKRWVSDENFVFILLMLCFALI
jgi:hypothetical protein